MNIVQVTVGQERLPAEKGGGNEAYIFNLSKEFVKMGHTVTILDRKYFRSDSDTEYIDGIKIVRLRAKMFTFGTLARIPKLGGIVPLISLMLNQLTFSSRVKRYLKKNHDSDVIHTYFSVSALVLGLVSSLRSKLVYTPISNRREKKTPGFLDRITLTLENLAVRHAGKVTIESESARTKLIQDAGIDSRIVNFVPLCVDTTRFNPSADIGNIRQDYGLTGKVVILFVGRIHPDKGVEYLVRAACTVVNEFGYNQTLFLLVGAAGDFGPKERAGSPYLAEIRRLIEEYGLRQNVKLTGALPLDDLRKLYTACDICVVPSVVDMGPQTPLEAMASGKPVVGTKIGTIPMHVKQGLNGLLVDPADEKQLAEAIRYLIDNPAKSKEMGVYGRMRAEDEFAADKVAQRFLKVYQG